MVRRCVVPSCPSTDLTTLVHRFPRKHCAAWQSSLQLNSYSVKDLLEKYVVCAHHFRISDYRHKESKHLNTTAIPTLDTIPETDKIPEVQSIILKVKTSFETPKLNSNLLCDKTRTYSNCVTLSVPLPQINNTTDSADLLESDTSIENNFYTSDCDIIEEDTDDMDEDMLIESNISEVGSNDLAKYDSATELFVEEDPDDSVTGKMCFVDETASNCDSDTKMVFNGHLTNYVELIHAQDETDDECALEDENEILFKGFSRKDLIDELVVARSRIKELETKLANIQQAHVAMIQNLNSFNKVLIS